MKRIEVEVDEQMLQRAFVIVGMGSTTEEVITTALEMLISEFEQDGFTERPIEVVHLPEGIVGE